MNKRTAKNCLLILAVLSLLLSGAAVRIIHRQSPDSVPVEEDPDTPIHKRLAFRVSSERSGPIQTVCCVSGTAGMRYVYLPSYAGMERVTVQLRTAVPLFLDGIPLAEGMDCGRFPLGQPLELSGEGLDSTQLVFVSSANVATLYVDTASGNMKAIHADKSTREAVSLALYRPDGHCEYCSRESDEIRGRGQSSWDKDKKGYNLYLDNNANLLSMGRAKKWALIPNLVDESNLRDWLIYALASRVSPYSGFAPDCAYVDLYLNGRYNGLYLLCEKTEIHPNRLDISPRSLLFDIDLSERRDPKKHSFDLGGGLAVEIKSSGCTDEQQQQLEDRLRRFQSALLSEDGIDPESGMAWIDFIDLDSFARKYLIEEISQNYDAGSCSQYYFVNAADDRIYAGPCWDYDYSLGNYKQKIPNCFLAQREWKSPKRYTPWFHGLWQKAEFRDRAIELYRTEFLPALKDLMETDLPQKAREIDAAVALNTLRWQDYYDSTPLTGSFEYMADYLEKHIDFLNSAWIDGVDYRTITFKLDEQQPYQFYCVPCGTTCQGIPSPADFGLKGDFYWSLEDGEAFDPLSVLTEDILLEARPITEAEDKR